MLPFFSEWVIGFGDSLNWRLVSLLFRSLIESFFNELKKSLRLSNFFVCVIQFVWSSRGIERFVNPVGVVDEDNVPFKPFGVLNKRSLRDDIRFDPNKRDWFELFDNERSNTLNDSLLDVRNFVAAFFHTDKDWSLMDDLFFSWPFNVG